MEEEGSRRSRKPVAAMSGSLDLQMQRLQLGDIVCKHGLVLPFAAASECEEFVATFNAEFAVAQGNISDCFQAAIYATRKKYAKVWCDSVKVEWIVSAFVANGIAYFLNGDSRASCRTSFASFFEQWIALTLHKTQYAIDWTQICQLFYGDERTLRDYLKERTSCNCLV